MSIRRDFKITITGIVFVLDYNGQRKFYGMDANDNKISCTRSRFSYYETALQSA